MKRMAMLAVLILLTSCAGSGPGNPSSCAGWRAIYVSAGDVLTRETARDILAHNLTGQKLGCW